MAGTGTPIRPVGKWTSVIFWGIVLVAFVALLVYANLNR
jgi:hypothetical protein